MRLASTGGGAPEADLRTAVLSGLAPDGGLYLPTVISPMATPALESLRGASFQDVARAVGRHLFVDSLPQATVDAIVESAFDFPVPVTRLGDGTHLLELFHGPTLAFKDVGARFMARLVSHYSSDEHRPRTVLAATSGDTGSAVAHAFFGVPGTRTVILFPRGGVSDLQERQFSTLGGNVHVFEVDGVFDDCQRLVKGAFADAGLARDLGLTSANSINIARLLPQALYYIFAWASLPEGSGPPLFCTPSGNFGNLAAGLIAHRLGMPAVRFAAATNRNDVVPEYLRTGTYRPRPSIATVSNAMDVGSPSNFERILALYDHDEARIRADVLGSAQTDEDTRNRIGQVYRRLGVVLDPHTAVGHLALDEARAIHPEAPPVLLATAHPAKFPDVVEPQIGRRIPMPDRLARCLGGERRVESIPSAGAGLKTALRHLPAPGGP